MKNKKSSNPQCFLFVLLYINGFLFLFFRIKLGKTQTSVYIYTLKHSFSFFKKKLFDSFFIGLFLWRFRQKNQEMYVQLEYYDKYVYFYLVLKQLF